MKETRYLCDRCGEELVFLGWNAIVRGKKPKCFNIKKLLNGNPSGYDYVEGNKTLCADCTNQLEKFLGGNS